MGGETPICSVAACLQPQYVVVVEPSAVILLYAACVAAAVFSLGAVAATWLSRPSALRREVNLLADAVAEFERELIKQDAKGTELLKSVESIHEAVADDLERAETKRKQAAARESKRKNSAPEQDINNPTVLRQLARQQGFEV